MSLFKKKGKENTAKYASLVEAICADDGVLVNAAIMATTVANQGEVLDSILYITEAAEKSVDIIQMLIKMEVANTLEASTLFRGNSPPTKLMTAYAKMIGREYLDNTLRTLLILLLNSQEVFEVNPAKASPDDDIAENLENLMDWCERFVEQIVQTTEAMPLPFRRICHTLQEEVRPKFPTSLYITVGGFVFLRFICPAILAPVNNGLIVAQPTGVQQRRLTLLAKALQNLSNGVQFGAKESYLTSMNDFIEDYQEMLYKFFDAISVVPEEGTVPAGTLAKETLEDHYAGALAKVHAFLAGDKVKEDVLTGLRKADFSGHADQVEKLLAELGPP